MDGDFVYVVYWQTPDGDFKLVRVYVDQVFARADAEFLQSRLADGGKMIIHQTPFCPSRSNEKVT